MVIIDTTVWIDIFNGRDNPHTRWFRTNLGETEMGLTDLILCEVLQGADQDSEFNQALARLNRFAIYTATDISQSIAAAQNYRTLRARGVTVRKTIDCLIATFCIQNDHALLHHDRDFDHFEQHLGLRVVKV